MSEKKESKLGRKLLIGVLVAALLGFGLITAAVLSLSSAIGEDNTSKSMENAGFGGGLAADADIPGWLRPIITEAVAKHGCAEVTPSLIAAQLFQESRFNPRAKSPAKALGIAQFIPGTWAEHGIDGSGDGEADIWNPKDAVFSQVAYDCYLAKIVRKVPGDHTDNMLAAYNAGAYAVQKYSGVPPYKETRDYVRLIRDQAEKWAAPTESRISGGLEKVVAGAKEALGTPYAFGGTCRLPFEGANGCDCSSLVKYAWSKVGENLPRTTYDQVEVGSKVKSVKDLRPGDLIFSSGSASAPEHVAMYIGGKKVIDAPHTGATVRIKPLSYWEAQILVMKRPDYTEPAASGSAGKWVTPVTDDAIGTAYRVSGSMWSSGYHTGVDFPVSTGTPIRAVGPGTVVTAGWSDAYGYQVVIKHADGKYSQYAHQSKLAVSAGQKVSGGQRIGTSGATGNVDGPHLHFEIRTGPEYGSDIDPLGYLRSHGLKI
ncbi:peptidoglycan DD-metalloendopeptidase family protein [Streptomyces sp. MZ04]|uniref:peptidoglycan DD-metalloendopeptidase family protein n=1 Tax=Streptomyces sp. MZ04 TaxID=2559236 RepID=UPI00107E9481|nr:peptidoglycan DD-metalloendopeptidase family protein [Streptomyces sp. MZ04]TGA97454.1 peptidase M23 [Streptomyces sp. MZ04]